VSLQLEIGPLWSSCWHHAPAAAAFIALHCAPLPALPSAPASHHMVRRDTAGLLPFVMPRTPVSLDQGVEYIGKQNELEDVGVETVVRAAAAAAAPLTGHLVTFRNNVNKSVHLPFCFLRVGLGTHCFASASHMPAVLDLLCGAHSPACAPCDSARHPAEYLGLPLTPRLPGQ